MHMTSGYLNSQLNIGAVTQVKVGPGKLVTLVVNAGGTATLNDAATTGAAAAANQIAVLTAGSYQIIFPFFNGLVVASAGAACAVAFE
jgi:hypothetical protein